jgi:hypothetical protein
MSQHRFSIPVIGGYTYVCDDAKVSELKAKAKKSIGKAWNQIQRVGLATRATAVSMVVLPVAIMKPSPQPILFKDRAFAISMTPVMAVCVGITAYVESGKPVQFSDQPDEDILGIY